MDIHIIDMFEYNNLFKIEILTKEELKKAKFKLPPLNAKTYCKKKRNQKIKVI